MNAEKMSADDTTIAVMVTGIRRLLRSWVEYLIIRGLTLGVNVLVKLRLTKYLNNPLIEAMNYTNTRNTTS